MKPLSYAGATEASSKAARGATMLTTTSIFCVSAIIVPTSLDVLQNTRPFRAFRCNSSGLFPLLLQQLPSGQCRVLHKPPDRNALVEGLRVGSLPMKLVFHSYSYFRSKAFERKGFVGSSPTANEPTSIFTIRNHRIGM